MAISGALDWGDLESEEDLAAAQGDGAAVVGFAEAGGVTGAADTSPAEDADQTVRGLCRGGILGVDGCMCA
mgnify:CR=1 FL=1